MEVDDIALSTVGVGLGGGRLSVGADEGSIDIVEHISPHFANPCVKGLNLSDQQREVEESNALWTSVRAFTEEYFRGFVVLIKNISRAAHRTVLRLRPYNLRYIRANSQTSTVRYGNTVWEYSRIYG